MWDKIKKNKSKIIFIDCCVLLGEIVIKFYPDEIQDKFFEEIFEIFKTTIATTNFSTSSQEEINYYHKFEIFLYSILTKINNYSNILNVDNFLFLLENFHPEIKLNICFTIMGHIISSKEKLKDPYLAFSLLKIGKYIHDSVETYSSNKDAVSPSNSSNILSRRKEVTHILTEFIGKVDFGIDYENYLNFLTDARGTYTDIEEIIELLITEVQRLCIQTYKLVKGKHNKKTLRFCKVCVAYCQITIPSFKNPLTQMKLLFSTAQIALTNNLISECDSILKMIITLISKIIYEIDKKEIETLTSFFKSLVSFLVIVPSNPETPFQLVSGIINIFQNEVDNGGTSDRNTKKASKAKIKLSFYLSLVKYLTTQLQIKLPYHLANIDSNDEIFISDEIYRSEGNNLIEKIITDILGEISEFDSILSNYDYDDHDFLALFCVSCAECFMKDFERTKYSQSVVGKLIELARKYIESLKKTSSYKQKTDSYREYINRLDI
jgi:hypothetical protein